MKLVKVEHSRCDETSGVTYLLAPDTITEEVLQKDANTAFNNHIKAIKDFKLVEEYPRNYINENINKFPDEITIAEAKKLVKDESNKREEYRDKKQKAIRDFGYFMKELGYVPLGWEEEGEVMEANIYWGHRHGDPIDMAITITDYCSVRISKNFSK